MNNIELLDENLGLHNHIFNNKKTELKKYKVKFEDLKFNPFNTRVRDIISTKFSELSEQELFVSEEVQDVIYFSLKEGHKDSINKRLLKKLISGQIEPLVINEQGIIISGNNRYSLLKENFDNTEIKSNYRYIEVALIEGKLTRKEIIEWELSTQRETDLKLNYNEMNLLLRVRDLSEGGASKDKIMNIASLNDLKEIDRFIRMAGLYDKLLMFAGVPKKADLHRSISVYSFLDGLDSQLEKKTTKPEEKKILQNIYFNTILGTDIPVQKFRDLTNKFVGNRNIELPDRMKILKSIDKKISDEVSVSIEKGSLNSFDTSEKDYRKKMEDKDFGIFFENLSHSVTKAVNFKKDEMKNSFSSILKNLNKNKEILQNIEAIKETTIAYDYSEEETKILKKELKTHSKIIEELLKEI